VAVDATVVGDNCDLTDAHRRK